MKKEIIDFINQNEELIDDDNWEEVYNRAGYVHIQAYELTEILFDANIRPENYLSKLPMNFSRRLDIRNFEIPNNITSIGYAAFYECTNLESIEIPDSVKSIGGSAFWGCESLTSVTIGNGVESISTWSFYGCTSLKSVTIGNRVKEIGEYAFLGCTSLTNIEMPNSVTTIDENAFEDCGENLVINYKGTKAQFRSLTRGCFKDTYFTAHCIDGDIIKKKR